MKDSWFHQLYKNAISKLVAYFFFDIRQQCTKSKQQQDGFISRKIESNWIVGHNTLVPHKDKGGFELPLGEQMGFY